MSRTLHLRGTVLRFQTILTFILVLTAAHLGSQRAIAVESPAKYSKVRIQISSKDDVLALAKAGLVLGHVNNQGSYIETVLNSWELEVLKGTPAAYQVLVDDLEEEYRKRPKLSGGELKALEKQMQAQFGVEGFGFGSMGGYYTFSEAVAKLDEMSAAYSNIITAKQSIGTSIEGRDIWMLKISDNPNVDESEEEVLYTSIMHAREPQGLATVLFFMFYMLENYGTDPNVTFLVDNRELYFIPVINPDGYVYNETTNPNGGGNWRKNRRNNGGGIFGVDINRNFDYQWGFDNQGSSPNPSSSTYRGTSPASEPETQAVQDFAIGRELTMTFNFHSFAESYNFPWGYLPNFFTPDHAQFVAFSQDMSQFNNYIYGTVWQNLGYVTNGYSNDWFYGEQTLKGKVFSWTVEVGTSFWPNPSNIFPFAVDNLYPNLVLAQGTGGGLPSPLTIVLSPASPPITIPPGGGEFEFTVNLFVAGSGPQTFDIWNEITTPNSNTFTTIGPVTLTLGGGFNASVNLSQRIPAGAPPGDYTYEFKTGTFPNTVEASSKMAFTKSATTSASTATLEKGAANWSVLSAETNELWSPRTWDQSLAQTTEIELPEKFVVEQNYPNPFNPATNIAYALPQPATVRIVIYDVVGRQVRELLNEPQSAGYHVAHWNGKNHWGQPVASGIYLYRIVAGEFVQSRKMVLVK